MGELREADLQLRRHGKTAGTLRIRAGFDVDPLTPVSLGTRSKGPQLAEEAYWTMGRPISALLSEYVELPWQ